jgi:eukaryotic-like serine/threonine-protein kinase
MPLSAGTRLGPYEIIGLVGAGGMGEVYKARDTRLDRTIAIKVLPADISDDPRGELARRAEAPRADQIAGAALKAAVQRW